MPAAASGAGSAGTQPLSNRFLPPTQNVEEPDFFRDIPVMPGSKEILPLLISSYEVFITTVAMEYPTSFAAKYEWIEEHFPFFPESHIVFCGDKSIIAADFLVDDNAHHFERFKNL